MEDSLLARLRQAKGPEGDDLNLEQLNGGPKNIEDLEQEERENEAIVFLDDSKRAVRLAQSTRFYIWLTPKLHLQEQMRVRKGVVISSALREYSGSGTIRKGESPARAVLRELRDEMPELIELLLERGVILGVEHLDFRTLVKLNGTDSHESSVYLGLKSVTLCYNVVLDLAQFGFTEPPWKNGRVSYDMGTFIPQGWYAHEKNLVEPIAERPNENLAHALAKAFPLVEEPPIALRVPLPSLKKRRTRRPRHTS